MAVARALLRLDTCPFLILDEASASLDAEADQVIQRVIRTEMKGATLLCIARKSEIDSVEAALIVEQIVCRLLRISIACSYLVMAGCWSMTRQQICYGTKARHSTV